MPHARGTRHLFNEFERPTRWVVTVISRPYRRNVTPTTYKIIDRYIALRQRYRGAFCGRFPLYRQMASNNPGIPYFWLNFCPIVYSEIGRPRFLPFLGALRKPTSGLRQLSACRRFCAFSYMTPGNEVIMCPSLTRCHMPEARAISFLEWILNDPHRGP